MDKMSILNSYIEKCDENIERKDPSKSEILMDEVIGVFEAEIPDIKSQLTMYGWGESSVNYPKDLAVIKAILMNYRANLKREDGWCSSSIKKVFIDSSYNFSLGFINEYLPLFIGVIS